MAFKVPLYGRTFSPDTDSQTLADFGLLKPIADQAPWSVIAVVKPSEVAGRGGIVCCRPGIEAGKPPFSVELIEGRLTVAADMESRGSKLSPPTGEWSMTCATISADGTHFYLGLQSGQVIEDRTAGMVSAGASTDGLLRVGRMDGVFPGALGLVCLYSANLDPPTAHAVCRGETSPLDVPGLAFAWQPLPAGDCDLVSVRVRASAAPLHIEPPTALEPSKAKAAQNNQEFLLAGHSNYFAMGAPKKYRGPRGLVEGEAHGRRGYYVMEENSAERTRSYWTLVAESSNDRDVVISWQGNQHVTHFLFEPVPYFDFVEHAIANGTALRDGAMILPRRLIKAYFQPTIQPLNSLLAKVNENRPKSITVVGTPPPRGDLAVFEKMIRPAPFWREVAAKRGLDLDSAHLVQPIMLLKLWSVLQQMLEEAAAQAGARFIAVPDFLRDAAGFLNSGYGIDTDFTHANDRYGSQMMQAALS